MNRAVLGSIVFITGSGTMVMELTGSRIFAPYLGTSLFVWTSLIGVILGALSLGYWWGGKLADRMPEARVFSAIIFFAGVCIGLVAFLSEPVLILVSSLTSDIRAGAVVSTVVLFGVPSVLLGMVPPYAIRLCLHSVEESGKASGALYALSTIGSIVGTFLTGFVLISFFSNTLILLLVAMALLLSSILAYPKRMAARLAALILLGLAATSSDLFAQVLKGKDMVEVNTAYNSVRIFDAYSSQNGRPVRLMQVNDENDSMMYRDGDDLANEYTKYYRLDAHFNPGLRKVLMIGGAAYSYPKDFLKNHPEGRMDVIEIDPGLTNLAREYFGLMDDPRLRIFHEDARTYLNRSTEKYDVIYGDAFKSFSVPFQLATREAVGRMHALLNDEGVCIMNLISAIEGDEGKFLRAEVATFKEFFPQVYLFPVHDKEDGLAVQNVVMIALKYKAKPKFYSRDPQLNGFLQHIWIKDVPKDVPVLKDDFAPVDRYTLQLMDKVSRPVSPVRMRLEEWILKLKGEKSK
jgi:spermidine synthase